jgi:hypothetical protein
MQASHERALRRLHAKFARDRRAKDESHIGHVNDIVQMHHDERQHAMNILGRTMQGLLDPHVRTRNVVDPTLKLLVNIVDLPRQPGPARPCGASLTDRTLRTKVQTGKRRAPPSPHRPDLLFVVHTKLR